MLIPLICKQCGGKLEIEQAQVHEAGEAIIVSSDQMFTCPQCGTKYLPGEKVKRAPGNPSIVINGNFNSGTIVIGTGNVISKGPVPVSSHESQQITQSPPDVNKQKNIQKVVAVLEGVRNVHTQWRLAWYRC